MAIHRRNNWVHIKKNFWDGIQRGALFSETAGLNHFLSRPAESRTQKTWMFSHDPGRAGHLPSSFSLSQQDRIAPFCTSTFTSRELVNPDQSRKDQATVIWSWTGVSNPRRKTFILRHFWMNVRLGSFQHLVQYLRYRMNPMSKDSWIGNEGVGWVPCGALHGGEEWWKQAIGCNLGGARKCHNK